MYQIINLSALSQLRRKLKYPTHDPAPNLFQDTRTDLEKIQDIIKVSASLLEPSVVYIWNQSRVRYFIVADLELKVDVLQNANAVFTEMSQQR